jgi:hypothetical protein
VVVEEVTELVEALVAEELEELEPQRQLTELIILEVAVVEHLMDRLELMVDLE